jgi:hypothetical protein
LIRGFRLWLVDNDIRKKQQKLKEDPMAKKDLIFNKNTILKLENNYSPIKEIALLDGNSSTTNTFNTFWHNIGKKNFKSGVNSNGIPKNTQKYPRI